MQNLVSFDVGVTPGDKDQEVAQRPGKPPAIAACDFKVDRLASAGEFQETDSEMMRSLRRVKERLRGR